MITAIKMELQALYGLATRKKLAFEERPDAMKGLGRITMLVSAILFALKVSTSFLRASLALVPFFIGRDLFVVGTNFKEMTTKFSQSQLGEMNKGERQAQLTNGTFLLHFLPSN